MSSWACFDDDDHDNFDGDGDADDDNGDYDADDDDGDDDDNDEDDGVCKERQIRNADVALQSLTLVFITIILQ